jgi:hypothetical protein
LSHKRQNYLWKELAVLKLTEKESELGLWAMDPELII